VCAIVLLVAVPALSACAPPGPSAPAGSTTPTATAGAPETPFPTLTDPAPVGDPDVDGVWSLSTFRITGTDPGLEYATTATVVDGTMRVSIEEASEATLAMDGAFRVEVSGDTPWVEVRGSGDEQAGLEFDPDTSTLHWTSLPGGSGLTFSIDGQTVDGAMFGAGGTGPFQPAAEMTYAVDGTTMRWTYSVEGAEAEWVWDR
jgi:hypothetical protein